MLYDWQKDAIMRLDGRSAILSAPTGSGKTRVAYVWSGLLDVFGNSQLPPGRVIFTAPIKALSNERYMSLKSLGFDVGIETGDFKKNAGAIVLCCTQEIYTLKYAHLPGQKVIVDEFHYIFNDRERTRAYIDGLRATSPDSDLLVMSATFGNPEVVRNYMEKITLRNFDLYESDARATELIFRRRGVKFSRIHDALVFVFSRKGAIWIADRIAETRRRIDREHRARLREIADILETRNIPNYMYRGVGTYFGSMLPKDKLFVETAFRERILDVVVGTDALSLGVNLPAETVIFGQMSKYIDGPLSKNEFMQMSGRAGRKGYFNPGYVTYIPRSRCEDKSYDTGKLYRAVLDKEPEPAQIKLLPAVGRLLKKEVSIEVEAKIVSECSLPRRKYGEALAEVEALLREIRMTLGKVKNRKFRKRVRKVLAEIWSDEMDVDCNIEMAILFAKSGSPEAMDAAAVLRRKERNYLQALLKVKRFANRLPDGYRFARMNRIEAAVDRIDATVFGFEEKIDRIKETESRAE